jgi:hypothetical protein
MFGRTKSRFWFCVSIRQPLLPLVLKSLWVPPLPLDTNGEVEMWRPRVSLLHVSTVVLPCAASRLKEPATVPDSHTDREASRVLPR